MGCSMLALCLLIGYSKDTLRILYAYSISKGMRIL